MLSSLTQRSRLLCVTVMKNFSGKPKDESIRQHRAQSRRRSLLGDPCLGFGDLSSSGFFMSSYANFGLVGVAADRSQVLRTGSQYATRGRTCSSVLEGASQCRLEHSPLYEVVLRCLTRGSIHGRRRSCRSPVPVPAISIPKNVPEQPLDDPILFVQAGAVVAEIIIRFSLRASLAVDPQGLPVHGRRRDLAVGKRGFDGRVASQLWKQGIAILVNTGASSAGILLHG